MREVMQGVPEEISLLAVSAADKDTGLTGRALSVWVERPGGVFVPGTGTLRESGWGWYNYLPSVFEVSVVGEVKVHAEAIGAGPMDRVFEVKRFLLDGSVNDVPARVDAELTLQHGVGSWQGVALGLQQIREAMLLAPVGVMVDGSIDQLLHAILGDLRDAEVAFVDSMITESGSNFPPKQSWETRELGFDFTTELGLEAIESVEVLAAELESGDDATEEVISNTRPQGPGVAFQFRAGVSGLAYKITARVTGAFGSQYEKDGTILVLDI